mmetsp:Transcript_43845/g.78856  ORF Transcript_43845/g.78856 Transcript_43845/m.78856 type:complete len:85 (-) Transcript_43845:944-1198(-)
MAPTKVAGATRTLSRTVAKDPGCQAIPNTLAWCFLGAAHLVMEGSLCDKSAVSARPFQKWACADEEALAPLPILGRKSEHRYCP